MLAAVIPLPSEEVTPPVTKTYFDIGRAPPGVFQMLQKTCPAVESRQRFAPHLGLVGLVFQGGERG
jgi:hypothetical protein